MLIEIRENNPDERQIREVAKVLKQGGLVIVPTDSVYAVVCHLNNLKGIAELAKRRGKKIHQANFSLLCKDLSSLSKYCQSVSNPVFKLLKRIFPGPYTIILNASHEVPRLFRENKKTIGIRIPDNVILQAILKEMDEPLVASSIHSDDEIVDYLTDPYEIETIFGNSVQLIVDGGVGGLEPSTIIDCTGPEPELVRQGKGIID